MTVDGLALACGKLKEAFPDGVITCVRPSYDGILFNMKDSSSVVKYFYVDGKLKIPRGEWRTGVWWEEIL